ncbi:MAG: hypothetical protein ABW116_05515 [Candidatus Sedimenticola sp. 20ELBAFRAG]
MHRTSTVFKSLFAIALSLWFGLSWAVQPQYPVYPGYAPYPYGAPAQQPQQPQQPAQGTTQRPPAYQGWPGYGYPSYTQQPQQSVQTAPKAEVTVSQSAPYIQQSLIMALKITSSGNLSRLEPELPRSEGLAVKKLEGPITSVQGKQIINEYRYAVTPIRAGQLTLPRFTITGTHADGRTNFSIETPLPIALNVKPANPTVKPWLPLHAMVLQAYLQNDDHPAAGKPLSLVIDISAVGLTGIQLPSLASQLEGGPFRVYREKTEQQGSLSPDKQFLRGHKTETFTLVPQHGGKLLIPELQVSWWNVDTATVEITKVPVRQLVASGKPGPQTKEGESLLGDGNNLMVLLPLAAGIGFLVGFGILSWLRKRRFAQVVEEEVALFLAFILSRSIAFLTWLSPIRRLQKIRQLLIRALPRPFRLWFCVRLVENEENPMDWSYMLRFLANKHLDIPVQRSLPMIGKQLAQIHRGTSEAEMVALMRELDSSLYGGTDLDFTEWKRRFRRQLRPSLRRRREQSRDRGAANKLPPLNPTAPL